MADQNTLHEQSLMLLIDPSQDTHIALERALITSRLRAVKPKLHLFFCVDEENTDLKARNRTLFKNNDWLQKILQSIEKEGLEYNFELCWSTQWNEAVLNYADRINPDVIFVPDSLPDARRSYFTNSKWALLRNASCPVMIVRPGASNHRKKVLAAINIQNEKAKYIELNNKIISQGSAVAKLYGADFFIVNAYPSSEDYPNREKIIKLTKLPSKNIHVAEGEPDKVIAEYARRIDADIVLMGIRPRKGAIAIMQGNTAGKILSKIPQDVMTFS